MTSAPAGAGDPPRCEFRTEPAWYQTDWFYAACALLFLGAFCVLYRVRLRRATAVLQRRMDAEQSERERIARDLQDTLLQTVYGLMLRFEVVANHFLPADPNRQLIDEALDQADRTIVEGRDRLSDLRSTTRLDSDLPASLRKVGEELVRDHPATTFSFRFDGAVRSLKPLVERETRMIVIEALTNAFRHADATSVMLDISSSKNQWVLRIQDDGVGIGKELLESGRAQHWGMRGMRERARLIGATLDVSSGIGDGTEISLTLRGATAFA